MCIGHRSFTMTPHPYFEGAGSEKKHGWASYAA